MTMSRKEFIQNMCSVLVTPFFMLIDCWGIAKFITMAFFLIGALTLCILHWVLSNWQDRKAKAAEIAVQPFPHSGLLMFSRIIGLTIIAAYADHGDYFFSLIAAISWLMSFFIFAAAKRIRSKAF